ncbi:hypothetical protein VNO77_19794 [Canavalia gladiata]|uniref:Uncharacterized protein n=1 Tax=Canavalia gladiata TaxID=3824 RepID=A0AAN9LP15_CANGL
MQLDVQSDLVNEIGVEMLAKICSHFPVEHVDVSDISYRFPSNAGSAVYMLPSFLVVVLFPFSKCGGDGLKTHTGLDHVNSSKVAANTIKALGLITKEQAHSVDSSIGKRDNQGKPSDSSFWFNQQLYLGPSKHLRGSTGNIYVITSLNMHNQWV